MNGSRTHVITRGLACLTVVLWLHPATALAQPESTITGTITDTSGGVLPGTRVEAIRDDRIVDTATTNAAGQYRLTVPTGERYQVRAQLLGFASRTMDVVASGNVTQDFELAIGGLNDSVVVTATRTLQSSSLVSDSLTVFDATDLAELGSHSVADVVAYIPGLDLGTTGREGGQTSLFTRGGESDYNHVLVDGVRVNINGGQFDFSRISTAEIDRIEVVRGAQSSLYGSDAIGSVVQIFTRRGSGAPRLTGSIEGGSFRTVRGDARILGGLQDRIDYQVGIGYRGTDGAFGDILPQDDEFDQTSIDANAGGILNDRAAVRSGVRYADANGYGVGPIDYAPGDTGQVYDSQDLSWYLNFEGALTPMVNHRAGVNIFRYDSLQEDTIADPLFTLYTILEGTPGALFPNSPRLVRQIDETTYNGLVANPASLGGNQFLASTPFGAFFGDFPFLFEQSFRRYEFDYQADVTWMVNPALDADQVLSLGYEYLNESDSLNAGFSIENRAYFAQQQFNFNDQWFVTAGGRVDDNTRFGTEFSPKVSLGGFPVPFGSGELSSLKLFTSLGVGIKNPTFGELFGGDFADGNPTLSPERARTFDVGAEVTLLDQRWLGRVAFFDNEYEDQVAFLSTGFALDGQPDYINVAGSEAHGVELEFALQRPVHGVTASASYALVDTEVVATVSTSEQFQPGQPLLRRPKHSGTVRITYTRGMGSVHFNLRAASERHDAAFAGLFTPDFRSVDITVNPGYTVMNLGGQVRLTNDLTMYLQIENLTDARYSTALGFPAMPRAVMVGGRFDVDLVP